MRPHGRIERLGGIGETPARAWRRRTLRGAASSVGRIALLFSLPASLPRLVRRSPDRIRAFRQSLLVSRAMFVLIVGCGRVGSSVARAMLREGHSVSCLDEDPESHARLEVGLEKSWEDLGGKFTVGAGLDTEALVAAGIEHADAFIASTDGDNTNIVIAQIAQRRYNVPTVIARILD